MHAISAHKPAVGDYLGLALWLLQLTLIYIIYFVCPQWCCFYISHGLLGTHSRTLLAAIKMAFPRLRVNNCSPVVEDPIKEAAGENEDPNSGTRKALHQNIFEKLRPVPFQYHWTVWHDKHSSPCITFGTDSSNYYENRLYILHEDVADIATFYRVYNNYPWDKVHLRDSVHIFRKGVKPVWEDPENLRGGCWRFRVQKNKAQAFFHEIAILCMANEFQAVLEKGLLHLSGSSSLLGLV